MVPFSLEWDPIVKALNPSRINSCPVGVWFEVTIDFCRIVFIKSGEGKTNTASCTQYCVDYFRPSRMVLVGVCGGFEKHTQVGDLVIASSTAIYDFKALFDAGVQEKQHMVSLEPFILPGAKVGLMLSGDGDCG